MPAMAWFDQATLILEFKGGETYDKRYAYHLDVPLRWHDNGRHHREPTLVLRAFLMDNVDLLPVLLCILVVLWLNLAAWWGF